MRKLWLLGVLISSGWQAALLGADSTTGPTPWQDDAALRDIQFIGSRVAYAVGDHGAVWKSGDGGQTWAFLPTPTQATLHSASFLTEQMGWIVGGEWQPYAQLVTACVLTTADGGATWTRLPAETLPGLHYVRFFSPDVGIAAGRSSPRCPSGLYRTEDGGLHWMPLAGEADTVWTAGRFLAPDLGAVAGRKGRLSLVGGDQLLASKLPPLASRTIADLTLSSDETGWLVGEGGLVLTTTSGGVVWQAPPTSLPVELRNLADFQAVEQRGDKVWIAGRPGSVIWHSPDRGQTWRPQATGQPTPIERLRFANERVGCAVGAFGSILRTEDGGETWKAVRAGGRRAAWLAILPQPSAMNPLLVGQWSAEEGYRGAIWAISPNPEQSPDSLTGAMQLSLGNDAAADWRLPLDAPDLQRSGERLLEAWQKRAENKAPALVVGTLVRQIRMWRPEVVVVPTAREQDALSQFAAQATLAAIEQAGDPTRALDQQELLRLPAWKVPRVVTQLPPGSRGDWTIDSQTLLPRLGHSLGQHVTSARAWLGTALPGESIAFRSQAEGATGTSVFAGLPLVPGSAARRPLLALHESALEAAQKRAQTRRNFLAVMDRSQTDDRGAAQLVGQLPMVLRDLRPADGAMFLADVAQRYRAAGRYELAEAAYLELIRRHGNEPAAAEALRWLLQYWTSAEVAWQRMRTRGATASQQASDPAAVEQRIQQAGGLGQSVLGPNARQVVPAQAVVTTDRSLANPRPRAAGAPPDAVAEWRNRAAELAQQLEQQSPLLFEQPAIQFPLAALKRTRGSASQADAVYRQWQNMSPDAATKALLDRELWLGHNAAEAPRHLTVSRLTKTRPHLDGVLSDPCWQHAQEIVIGAESADGIVDPTAMVLIAHDEQFLYLAGRFDRQPTTAELKADLSDREHDADLTGFDRFGIALDIDRDYTTWYALEVDQRGQTRDQCWDDPAWNPQWYVATDVDDRSWRIELAIPWTELAPAAPQFREVWGLSLARVIPYAAVQTWSPPAEWPPRWNSLCLIRFE